MTYLENRPFSMIVTNGENVGSRAKANVQAIVDSQIILIPMWLIHELRLSDLQIGRIFADSLLLYLRESQELRKVLCLSTEQRYQWLIKNRPDLLSVASQRDIAFLLNMTPQRLSVVKREFKQN